MVVERLKFPNVFAVILIFLKSQFLNIVPKHISSVTEPPYNLVALYMPSFQLYPLAHIEHTYPQTIK